MTQGKFIEKKNKNIEKKNIHLISFKAKINYFFFLYFYFVSSRLILKYHKENYSS